jgi:hypothetical protein
MVRVVAAAVESGLVHGLPSAWARCLELTTSEALGSSCFWTACFAGSQAEKLLLSLLGQASCFSRALSALGFLGTRDAADVALEAMQAHTETNVRLAAEAFCAITGLNMEREHLVAAEPPLPDEPLPYEQDNLEAGLGPQGRRLAAAA